MMIFGNEYQSDQERKEKEKLTISIDLGVEICFVMR